MSTLEKRRVQIRCICANKHNSCAESDTTSHDRNLDLAVNIISGKAGQLQEDWNFKVLYGLESDKTVGNARVSAVVSLINVFN